MEYTVSNFGLKYTWPVVCVFKQGACLLYEEHFTVHLVLGLTMFLLVYCYKWLDVEEGLNLKASIFHQTALSKFLIILEAGNNSEKQNL